VKRTEPPGHAPAATAAPPVAPSRDSSLGYRPALDGIRAVAVLAVIGYHFDYTWLKGGFLGVDIFFVLSGYLITSLLLAEHTRSGTINLVAFWYRRAKRLLPALFVVLVVVAFWIGANASPFELPMRRDDLFWTLFYGANWHFIASGQDYFAQFASASPLRHTWSLAIEEQFYLAWPILIATALWLGRRRPAVVATLCIVGIAASTLAMALLYDPGDPSRAYYGTDARAHQLLVGALLAVLVRQYSGRRLLKAAARGATIVTVVGAVVLIAAFALLSDTDSLYYSGLSLVLALTAALVVWGVETVPSGPIARVISLRPFAWIGQISYGLYLWHWPVILAVTSASGPFRLLSGSIGLNGERLVLTFAAATASFYLVEQPIRQGVVLVIGPSIRRFAIATLVAIVAVGGTAYWQTSAAAPEITGIQRIPDCPSYKICLRHQGTAGAPVVAVIGDSIAQSLDPAFVTLAQEHDWTYALAAAGGCRATTLLTATLGQAKPEHRLCLQEIPTLDRSLIATWHPDVVVLVDIKEVEDFFGSDGSVVKTGSAEYVAGEKKALTDLVHEFAPSGPRMSFLEIPPRLHSRCGAAANATSSSCNVRVDALGDSTVASYNAVFKPYNAILREVAAGTPGVSTISITGAICPNRLCVPKVNGLLLRYDGLHFTAPAAVMLAPAIYRQMVGAGLFK
jgi:peptidoglycan/LPS O-acetylase OafA/YrhL